MNIMKIFNKQKTRTKKLTKRWAANKVLIANLSSLR